MTRFDIDTREIEQLARRMRPKAETARRRAQTALCLQIVKDCDPFVPFSQGTLSQSWQGASDFEAGVIAYDTPYARKVYYGDGLSFSQDAHPQATARWFEHAKALFLDRWRQVTAEMFARKIK